MYDLAVRKTCARAFSLAVVVFATTSLHTTTLASTADPKWLYCEATRAQDGAKVAYTFRIEDGIARTETGRWQVSESERELRLTYIWHDGRRDEGSIIIINRVTGELYHNAYNISVYRTHTDDKPCEQVEQKF